MSIRGLPSQNYNTEATPSIIFLDTDQRDRLLQLDCDSATSDGHVDDGFVSPFVGMTLAQVVCFVSETARDTVVNPYSVFMADECTLADQIILVVGIHDETREIEATVRMVPELLDLLAANLVIANTDNTEMKLNAEETGGVYRHDRLEMGLEDHGLMHEIMMIVNYPGDDAPSLGVLVNQLISWQLDGA
ncbi:hypothetical protein BO82DRAFT_365448 [Aspergillus uvarum CBS 121591]|uniref:DUF6924 domain-containing protein n=1 Tax=Aspergillus uvarum CBS 121591 TaxID=1448315 RepID=A0A319C9X4_9EURO|nr:hypothetical protein BO82DRAFT_365448 [Aspergillus uvarum CBS 121591]PYH81000.1 hypothetical protein BO82DRAFT_365448 [Aspergillus uvarum CBS 121591]